MGNAGVLQTGVRDGVPRTPPACARVSPWGCPMGELFFLLAIALYFVLLIVLVYQITRIRAEFSERIGAIAAASWRIKDELAAINKRAEGDGQKDAG